MGEWSQLPEANRHGRFGLLLACGSLIAAAMIWQWFSAKHEAAVQALLDRDLAALSISWQAVQALQRNTVATYFEEYVQDPRTLALLQVAQDPDRIELARLELFRHLSPAYERMVVRGMRQFHFHLPNGDSLLRFHHPSRFGDNLMDVRESIRRANNEFVSVFGFEVSRAGSGYRSVFPVRDEQGHHLGSVELSMPFKVLQDELQGLLPGHSVELLLYAARQRDIMFDDQQGLFDVWPASDAFLVEDPHRLLPDSPPSLPAEIHKVVRDLGERPDLFGRLVHGGEHAFRHSSNGLDYAVLMVPVLDPAGETVGLVASYMPEPALAMMDRHLRLQVLGAWLTLLVLSLFLFYLIRALDSKLAERNRLRVITDTLGQGLYLTDSVGRIVNANPFARELLGFSADQMQGQSAHDLFHRHTANDFESMASCSIIRTVKAGREYRDETVFRRADDRLFDVMVVSRPLLQRDRLVGTVTVFEDIHERKQAERALQERDLRLRKLGAQLPGFVYQYLQSPSGASVFIYASDGIRDIYGVTPEQVEGDATPAFDAVHADDVDMVAAEIAKSARELSPWKAVYRVHHPEKGLIWVEGHATPERLEDGSTLWHGYIHDVTEREHARRQLEESEAKYRTLVENAPVIIYRSESQPPWRMLHISQGAERLCGYASADFVTGTRNWGELVHSEDIDRLQQAVMDSAGGGLGFKIEYRIVRADGALRWVQETGCIHGLGQPNGETYLQGIITDITDQKNDQLQLQRSAHYDGLTGLPNRVLLADRLEQAMARARRSNHILAVVFIDLDHFKPINDEYGHDVGDELLVAVAERMRSSLRGADTLARLGGDEFVAVLSELSAEGDAQPLVRRLLDAVSSRFELQGRQLQVTGSIGLTFYPQSIEQDADQLLRQADQAMYQSKIKGRNTWHVFDLERDASVRGRHAAIERFSTALENQELLLHYQPQVNLRTGQVIGVEALIRWQHPERGLLMPGEFLHAIERTEVDIALGQWVLGKALEQRRRWSEAGLDLTMAVNLSAHCLQKFDFLSCVDRMLDAHPDLPPGRLEFEILESSALSNLDGVSALMRACAERGVRFALDDFGTGYSSLSYLKRLPVSVLKVDRSFVSDIDHDVDDLSILEGVLGLSRAFQMEVVAEGVETLEQGSLLLQLGCERAQGFAIARPMPPDEIPGWIRQWRPQPVWRSVRELQSAEYPLLYALVAAQSCIETLIRGLSDLQPPPRLSATKLRHIERVFCSEAIWPEREGFLSSLGDAYQGLRRLFDRLKSGVNDGPRAAEAYAQLEELRQMLNKARADLN